MRAWIVVVALVAACKGGKKDDGASAKLIKAALTVPTVAVDTVLAKESAVPPALLVIEKTDVEAGVRFGAAATWADLDAGKIKLAKTLGPLDFVDRMVREHHALGRPAIDGVKAWDENADSPIDLAALEDPGPTPNVAPGDPPPPEEEDKPDDGADESGGTGTAMALEEGKMGKKDSDRAEGHYTFKKNQEDPQLARQQAIEQARAAGILGSNALIEGGPPPLGTDRPNEDGTPSRVAKVQGEVKADGTLDLRKLIFIQPTAKVTKLIEVLVETEGAIAVSHAGKIRPLRLEFFHRETGFPEDYFVELRISTKGFVLEAVPDKPIDVADLKDLAAAIKTAREARGMKTDAKDSLVDVLVEPDVDVQRLVDVLVALDTAGVRWIGIGAMPNQEQLARRGHRIPTIRFGQPNAQGDLDKAIIRRVVKKAKQRVFDCYKTALAKNPGLQGTVQTQFFIAPDGKIAAMAATGVDPDVANCVAGVIKKLEFPKPTGGGGVQVNYPFTFRP